MRFEVPSEISHTIWEGALEPPTKLDPRTVRAAEPDAAMQAEMPNPQELPIASVGKPEVWRIEELYLPDKLPPHIQSSPRKTNSISSSFLAPSGRGAGEPRSSGRAL